MSSHDKQLARQKLPDKPPQSNGKRHLKREPPQWHSPKIKGWAKEVDKRLSREK
jgi:hypothetical protein